MARPTRKAVIVGLVGGTLFLSASTAQAGWLFVLAAGVLGLVLGSLLVRHQLGSIEVRRTAPGRVRVGDDMRLNIEVSNGATRSVPLVRVEDRMEAYEHQAVLFEAIPAGGSAVAELVVRAERRGDYPGGEALLTAGFPFGLGRTKRVLDVGSRVVVVPRWVDLRSFPILEPSSFPFETLHERARTGAGEEYLGVREYRPGDPPRTVHWRSTARIGRLVVREFQEETTSRVCLVVTGDDHGIPPDSSYETLISAAASIARYALVTGHPVDLVRAEPDGTLVRSGDVDREAVLDWLARARPAATPVDPLIEAALARVGRRGTVVLLATLAEDASEIERAVSMVQAAGSRPISVVARASGWTGTGDAESSVARLRARAPLRVIDRGEDLARCLG